MEKCDNNSLIWYWGQNSCYLERQSSILSQAVCIKHLGEIILQVHKKKGFARNIMIKNYSQVPDAFFTFCNITGESNKFSVSMFYKSSEEFLQNHLTAEYRKKIHQKHRPPTKRSLFTSVCKIAQIHLLILFER